MTTLSRSLFTGCKLTPPLPSLVQRGAQYYLMEEPLTLPSRNINWLFMQDIKIRLASFLLIKRVRSLIFSTSIILEGHEFFREHLNFLSPDRSLFVFAKAGV